MPANPIREKFQGLIENIQKGLFRSTHSVTGNPLNAGIGERVIDNTFAKQLYGDKDAFMTRYRDFEDQYYKALSDTENVRRPFVKNLDVDMMRSTGSIDLSILSLDARKHLEGVFAGSVLQIQELFSNAGFPTKQMPSANPYRIPHMFEVDQAMEHPAQVMLNKMIFNIDPTSSAIADVRYGSTNIASANDIERNLFQIQKMNDPSGSKLLDFSPNADGTAKKIVTFDVETTGLGSRSQVRSVALTQRGSLDELGETIVNFGYNSPRQGGILAGPTLSETLSEFISRSEKFSVVNNEEEFLQNTRNVFKHLNEADQVTAHNAKFDITQMIKTAQGMKGYETDDELKGLISIFNTRAREDKMFLVDTLEIGRAYITKKAQETIASKPGSADSVLRGEEYIKKFFSTESLADVTMGGKGTYAGVGDFAMNTNLLNLMAKEQEAPEIFERILKGSHIAETDTMLQDHIIKYVHTGELDFRDPLQAEDEFLKIARKTVFQSKATTAVTNIADPKLLTQTALSHITEIDRQGISGVQATISLQAVLDGDLLSDATHASAVQTNITDKITEGFIKFEKGHFKLFTGTQQEGMALHRDKAESHLRKLVADAKDDLHMEEIEVHGKKIQINRAQRQIMSLGITFEQNSAIEMMNRTLGLDVAQEIDPEKYVDNVGNLYRNFADAPDKMKIRDILRGDKSFESQMNFSSGLSFGNADANEVSAKLLSHAGTALSAGMKHGFLGPEQTIMSNVLSSQTTSLAKGVYDKAIRGEFGDESQSIIDKFAYASDEAYSDITSQFGISHYKKQSSIRLAGNEGQAKKILLDYDYFKSLKVSASPGSTLEVGTKIAEKNLAVSFSVAERKENGEMFKTLNLVWKEGQDESGLTARSIAEQLHADFIASDDYKGKITSVDDMDELHTQAAMFKETYRPEEAYQQDKLLTAAENKQKELVKIADNKEKSIQAITESIEERGVGIGSFGDSSKEQKAAVNNILDFASSNGKDIGTFNDSVSFQANILDETDDVLSLSPVYDKKVIDAGGPEAGVRLKAANEEVMADASKVGRALQDDTGLKERALKNLKLGRGQTSLSTAVENYNKFKGPVGIAALGLTALAAGYYIGKRKKETNSYDETLEQQPTESFRQNTSSNYGSSVTSFNSAKRNPLATAGVVGNLDNRKIGHTQMGNNKYNHLYGG